MDQLKNSLGGQLGNLLNKGLAAEGKSDQSREDYDRNARYSYDREAGGDSRYADKERRVSPSERFSRNREPDIPKSYAIQNSDRYERGRSRERSESPPCSNNSSYSYSASEERRPLFPIASSSEEKPKKSILKKSILKKSEPVDEKRDNGE